MSLVRRCSQSFTPKEFADSVQGVATLGWSIPGKLPADRASWIQAPELLQEFTLEELARSASELQALGWPVPTEVQDGWIQAARARPEGLRSPKFSSSVRAITTMGWWVVGETDWNLTAGPDSPPPLDLRHHEDDFESSVLPGAVPLSRRRGFKSYDLGHRAWMLAADDSPRNSEALGTWINEAQIELHALHPRDLSAGVWALARLDGRVDEDFQTRWVSAARDRLRYFRAQDLTLSLWSLMVLHAAGAGWSSGECRGWMVDAIAEANRMASQEDLPLEDLRQLAVIYEYGARILNLGALEKGPPLERQLQDAESVLKAEPTRTSNFQTNVYNVVKSVVGKRCPPTAEPWTKETFTRVDIALESRRVIIQVDGPHHYVRQRNGTRSLRPSDMLLNAVWRAHGWHVVRVDHKKWESLEDEKERRRFIRQEIGN